ncbi:chaperonin 10-like protein [Pavlovales sp. CCMP2436]|nr:chaperonin 10-like protein [Pavlovales sp. CCMP2436]
MTDLSKPLMTEAYGAKAQGAKLELMAIELPPLTSSQGVGKVVACGANVRGLEVGDTVGVGWIRDSCGLCEPCGCGRENMCDNGYKGTYFAFLLPANLPPHVAAPLMCAGGTVFEPIVDLVRPGVVVGVGALGGLGTLALKLSKLYGGKGIPPASSQGLEADWIPIIFTGKKIGGSIVTGSQRMKLMLKLASEHLDFITDISESTQAVVRPFSEVNEAMESLMSQSSSAYRTVLQW